MTAIRRVYIALMITLVVCIHATAARSAPPESISLATHIMCPYSFYTAEGTFDGLAVRTVRYALARMNVALDLVVVPWGRAQMMVRNGYSDGFFAASQNEARDVYATHSVTIAEQQWDWCILTESTMTPDMKEFKDTACVGAFNGSNMLYWLECNEYKVLGTPPNTRLLVEMLLARRIDAIVANDLVLEKIITAENLSDRLRVYPLKNKPLGVYFSNTFLAAHPGFLETFNRHVLEYRKTPEARTAFDCFTDPCSPFAPQPETPH